MFKLNDRVIQRIPRGRQMEVREGTVVAIQADGRASVEFDNEGVDIVPVSSLSIHRGLGHGTDHGRPAHQGSPARHTLESWMSARLKS